MADPITVTDAAAEHLSNVLFDHPGMMIRVSIDDKGCAGHKYKYDIITDADVADLDVVVNGSWGSMVLESKSVMYLLGSTLDLIVNGFDSHLSWINPWVTSSCGCGESFGLAKDRCVS